MIYYKFVSGNIYGILGRNGFGKSVLLKIISGLCKQEQGKVSYDEIDYNVGNVFPRDVGISIEDPSFLNNLTGFDNLELLASIQNKIGKDDINKILNIANLTEEKDKKYKKYSLGMKQKLSLAQAFMENPKVILLDELFNGIDRVSVDKIKSYLLVLKKEDVLIIITIHIKDDIVGLCDVLLELEDGKLKNYEGSKE